MKAPYWDSRATQDNLALWNLRLNFQDDVKISFSERGAINPEVISSIPAKPKKTENSNLHGFELHKPSSKGTELLFQVMKQSSIKGHFNRCTMITNVKVARCTSSTSVNKYDIIQWTWRALAARKRQGGQIIRVSQDQKAIMQQLQCMK